MELRSSLPDSLPWVCFWLGGRGVGPGLLALIFAPLAFLVYVIIARVVLEGMVVAFRTAENTGRTAENTNHLGSDR